MGSWSWPFCQQLVEPVQDPTLSLPTGAPLGPSARVFAELDVDDAVLRSPPKRKLVYDHCEIEKVMKRMDLMVTDHGVVVPNPKVLTHNQNMVGELAVARRLEHDGHRDEKAVDACARRFLAVNGFDEGDLASRSSRGTFKIFGKQCYADADLYVVQQRTDNIVVVVEDKWQREGSKLPPGGHLGQIVAEMLQAASTNYAENKVVHDVFAMRVVNYHVSFFRLVLSGQDATLESLIKTTTEPEKKLQLLCNHANPESNLGLSLIDKAERRLALQLAADMRHCVISSKA
jgi:hypothetical protein